jgi:hypothetical protein
MRRRRRGPALRRPRWRERGWWWGGPRSGVVAGHLARACWPWRFWSERVEAAQAEPLAGQHRLHLGGALLEHGARLPPMRDLGVAVLDAQVQGQVALGATRPTAGPPAATRSPRDRRPRRPAPRWARPRPARRPPEERPVWTAGRVKAGMTASARAAAGARARPPGPERERLARCGPLGLELGLGLGLGLGATERLDLGVACPRPPGGRCARRARGRRAGWRWRSPPAHPPRRSPGASRGACGARRGPTRARA